MYYTYDANGNLINEKRDSKAIQNELDTDQKTADGIYSLNYGIALDTPATEKNLYRRTYVWNEQDKLKTSVEGLLTVSYRYGSDGQRALKASSQGETEYFNSMWQMSSVGWGERMSKNIYVGSTRIATRNSRWQEFGTSYGYYNTYYYHSDHLGSAQEITDYKGSEYERIEYTPYGELWIEKVAAGCAALPYRFTGKEMDSETGLYYYGARYLDPKYSHWLSPDPAMGKYIPEAPVNDEAKKHNENLPGGGGVFNTVNLQVYHYAGNNPIKYTDPDGKEILHFSPSWGWGHHAIQRVFGYFNWYDTVAQKIGFNIAATKVQMGDVTLRLWRGHYGIFGVGGEIGLYGPHGGSLTRGHMERLGIESTSMHIFRNSNDTEITGYDEKKRSFWTTAFKLHDKSQKGDIYTKNTFNFSSESAASDFADKLNAGLPQAKKYKHNGNSRFEIEHEANSKIVTIIWGRDGD